MEGKAVRKPITIRLRCCKSKIYLIVTCIIGLNVQFGFGQNVSAGFTASQSIGCAPLSVTFNNLSVGAVSYKWDFGDGNSSTLLNPTNFYVNSGVYSVTLVAEDGIGNSDTLIKSNLINVLNKPIIGFTVPLSSMCINDGAVSFVNTSQFSNSYLWDFGDGTTSTSINPNHTYTSPGVYNVTLMGINTMSGCTTAVTKNNYITIHPSSTAIISSNITQTCDLSTTFQFSTPNNTGTSYTWSFGDGMTSSLQNPSHVYNAPGVYHIGLITTNQLGCKDTLVENNLINIKYNPDPVIINAIPLNGCIPVINSFSTNVDSVTSYLWSLNNGITSTLTSFNYSFYTQGDYNVSLDVIYANGCTNSYISDTIRITPTPATYYIINNMIGCAPLVTDFISLTNGTGLSYLWDFGDGNTSTLSNPSHVYSQGGSYKTRLKVTNSYGCYGSYSYTKRVEVTQLNSNISLDDPSGCKPHTVNFTTLGNSGLNYLWDFGDGDTSNLHSPSHVYLSNGNYNVSLIVSDNLGCVDTITKNNLIQVSNGVNNFNNPSVVTACAPFTVNLGDNSPGSTSWLWDFGDGGSSSASNPNHTYTSAGTYIVTLETQTNGSSCSQFVNPYATYIIKGGDADFSVSQTVCPPYTGTFTDLSSNAVSWFWEFGDGTTSTLQNPSHVYVSGGSYNVSLTITTSDGCTYTSFHNYAVTFLPLSANPIASTTDTVLPMTVDFLANSSGATGWLWDFGDGNTSNIQNPTHVYTTPGPYNITLTLSNSGCSHTYTYNGATFGSGPIQFGSPPDTLAVPEPVYSCVPYEFTFANPMLNSVSWLWDFGDGDTSTLENPKHIYTQPGVFDVTLIAWDQNGLSDTVYQPSMVYLNGPQSIFSVNSQNTCQGSILTLTDSSVNAAAYHWDFGDGATSSLSNPTHIYSQSGSNYVVSLTVVDSAGCSDYMSQSYYSLNSQSISADKRKVCVPDSVYFSSSNLNYSGFLWDFGDGSSSSIANPSHLYDTTGVYSVSLIVTDSIGCNDTLYLPYQISVTKPIADFTATPNNSSCYWLNVHFLNQSIGATDYYWDFGDSNYSTQVNPNHNYNQPGYYSVSLTAIENGCSNTVVQNNQIFNPNLKADFSYNQSSICFPITIAFQDSSSDAVSWEWDFGDGTTSTLQNPTKIYTDAPLGNIILTVTDVYGCTDSKAISPFDYMDVNLVLSGSIGCRPFTFSISDSTSNVIGYSWSMGDGSNYNSQTVSHIYNTTGVFNISLSATSSTGCTQVLSNIGEVTVTGPDADFITSNAISCSPTQIDFTDKSSGGQFWLWDFGDGSSSSVKNPAHIYNLPGVYSVGLLITDSAGCQDSIGYTNMVHITGSEAYFTASQFSGCAPSLIHFTDSSISASSWTWNFGDGSTSTLQNPIHTYINPGSYTVTLITEDTTGCQSYYTLPDTIQIHPSPILDITLPVSYGCAPLVIEPVNNSSNTSFYLWDFGDGTTSNAANPIHSYTDPGFYSINVIGTSQLGCIDTVEFISGVEVYQTPDAIFTIDESSGCSPLPVQFINNSAQTDSMSTYHWSFGNGSYSQSYSPNYVFINPGYYSITLVVSNTGGCSDTLTASNAVFVNDTMAPPAPLIRSVSVLNEYNIELKWLNTNVSDFKFYEVYRYNISNTVWDLIHTEFAQGNTTWNATSSFIDTVSSTSKNSNSYKVLAVDDCNQKIPLTFVDRHSSIDITANVSGTNIIVDWDPYDGCNVNEYEVYRSASSPLNFSLLGLVNGSKSRYIDSTVYCNEDVVYRIQATGLCGQPFKAYSDTAHINAPGAILDQKVDILRATVVDDEYVFVEWEAPSVLTQLVTGYELYRSDDSSNIQLLTQLPPGQHYFEDYNVDVFEREYFYSVKVLNMCNVETQIGLIGSSILLKSELDDQNRSSLNWTPYNKWDTGVDYYQIEKLDLNGFWIPVGTVGGNSNTFLDW